MGNLCYSWLPFSRCSRQPKPEENESQLWNIELQKTFKFLQNSCLIVPIKYGQSHELSGGMLDINETH